MAGDGKVLSDLAPAISELRHSRRSQPRAPSSFLSTSVRVLCHEYRRSKRRCAIANNGEDCRGAEDVDSVVIGIGHVAPAEGVGAHSVRRGLGVHCGMTS
jgi:hypothetical protein